MNREIKFRGQRVDNKEWVYGLPKYDSGGGIGYICGWMGEYDNPLYDEVEVIPETVGQYTGLKDKNGTEIYEGDIIVVGAITKEVKWITGGNYAGWNIGNGKRYKNSKGHEVIGNIYQNPELLNK